MEKNDTEAFSGVMFFNKKIMQEMFGNELSLAAVGEIDAVEFLTAIKTVHFIMQNIVAEKMLNIVEVEQVEKETSAFDDYDRENGYEDVLRMRDSYDRRRRLMVDAFRSMGLHCFEPLGAFYAFPSIRSAGMTSEEFCTALLRSKNVAAVPGTAFGPGGEGNIRCCYATALDKLNVALDRIARFVAENK